MLFSLSASHKSADLVVLEALSAAERATPRDLVASHAAVRGAVVLATCNRFEAYLDLADDDDPSFVPAVASVIDALAGAARMTPPALRKTLHFAHGTDSIRHLFAVASGLESVVVGEEEIAGQVRRALDRARAHRTGTPALEMLFQRALATSREVKSGSAIGPAGRSIVQVALDLAAPTVAPWADTRVLLVGTGRYAAASLAALRERGVRNARVYSVSSWGPRFAESRDIPLIHRVDYAREAALADLILCCTMATHRVLDATTLEGGRAALTQANEAPAAATTIVDLGLPRNVDPDVSDVPGTTLIDLETVRIHAPIDDVASLRDARDVVGGATDRFAAASRAREVGQGLAALRRHVLELADAEIARAERRGDFTLATEEALRHFAAVLLHQPMTRSRALADEGEGAAWLEGLSAVFGIDARQQDKGDDRNQERRARRS